MGYEQPAEWEKHRACWLAWPSHEDLWQEALPQVQDEVAALCRGIAQAGQESLEVLLPNEQARESATKALRGLPVRFHDIPFGDIWLRDTAPIFVRSEKGELAAATFAFNGWGGKYVLDHDDKVSLRVAEASGKKRLDHTFILEGGSVEVDGQGTVLTTRQCLLNANRSPGLREEVIERRLAQGLGAKKTIWLNEGLLNDHTDGHIDTIARFIAPAKVLCMRASGHDDANARVLGEIAQDLRRQTDAQGRKLEVIEIPSPGNIYDEDGRLMPASYVNFYIANEAVLVPTYGSAHDAEAVRAIAACFPERRTLGLPAKNLLRGGGSFHCITQQEPLANKSEGK